MCKQPERVLLAPAGDLTSGAAAQPSLQRQQPSPSTISFLELKKFLSEASEAAQTEETPAEPSNSGAGGGGSASITDRPQHAGLLQPPASPREPQLVYSSGLSRTSSERAAMLRGGGSKVLRSWRCGGSLSSEEAFCPRQLPDYGPRQQRRLQRRCCRAVETLERLQHQTAYSRREEGMQPALPKAALRFCKGLAFVTQRKAGLLAGCNWGHGFVIQRLPDGSFSPPCFLRLRYGSLGLTLGMHTMRSCHVLQTAEQVHAFVRDAGSVTFDVSLSMDLDPFEMEAPVKTRHHDAAMPDKRQQPHTAMVCDGLLWDLSLRAGFTLTDDTMNAAVYGTDTSVDEILAGRVAVPAEFPPLYDAIDALAAEAQVIRPTVSKFELARQQSLRRASAASSGTGLLRKVRSQLSKPSSSMSRSHGSTGSLTATAAVSAAVTPVGGSPRTTLAPPGASSASPVFKLFGDVEMEEEFHEEHTYELEEEEEEHQRQQQQQQRQE